MAIDTIKSWQEFTSDGTTAYFAFNFNYDFNRPEDIMVGIRTGDNTYTVVAPEHYELTPNASEDGGQIRFIQAIQNPIGIEIIDKIPAAGEIIRIERKSSQTSSATWQIGLDMTTLVNLFDRLFRLTQENKGRFDNTIKTFATQHNIKLYELLAEHNNTLLFWDDENKTLTPTEFPKKDIVRAKDGLFFRITADERSNVYLEWSENGITNWHSMNFGKIEEIAEEVKEIAQEAKEIAETADNKSTSAIQTANEAKNTAETALANSQQAIETSNTALVTSEEAKRLAETANDKSDLARADASEAKSVANSADIKSNQAVATSELAEQKAEQAVATSEQALAGVQSAVEAAERATEAAEAAEQAVQEYDTRITNNANAITQETTNRQNADDELQDQIDNLAARGRFLALWNATTGLPESNPGESPYAYKAGDYYIVGVVGETNYRPSGSEFVEGQPSTEVETEELATDDVYYYDGAVWRLQVNHGKTVSFANLAGQPEDNTALKNALDGKQPVGNYAEVDKSNKFTQPQTIKIHEASQQSSALKVLSQDTGASNVWKGRLVAGAKNKTFLMGVYNNLPILGAHSWADSDLETGANWEDLYINPDGLKSVYIGGLGNRANSGILKIQNSTTDFKAYYNKGSFEAPDFKEIATEKELATKQDKLTAGQNITIVDNVISSTGGGATITIVDWSK